MRSIRRFGYVEPIVWNERTGFIIGGHQRWRVLLEEGVDEAFVVVVDFDEVEEDVVCLTLNNPEIEGDWDDPLGDLLSRVESAEGELFEALGFEDLRKAVINPPPPGNEWDTECPCCSYKWTISSNDIEVPPSNSELTVAED